MRQHPPTRTMCANPDSDQLERQAKGLLEGYREDPPEALTK